MEGTTIVSVVIMKSYQFKNHGFIQDLSVEVGKNDACGTMSPSPPPRGMGACSLGTSPPPPPPPRGMGACSSEDFRNLHTLRLLLVAFVGPKMLKISYE